MVPGVDVAVAPEIGAPVTLSASPVPGTTCPGSTWVLATKKGIKALAIPIEIASIYSGDPIGPPNWADTAALICVVNALANVDSCPVIGMILSYSVLTLVLSDDGSIGVKGGPVGTPRFPK